METHFLIWLVGIPIVAALGAALFYERDDKDFDWMFLALLSLAWPAVLSFIGLAIAFAVVMSPALLIAHIKDAHKRKRKNEELAE